MQPAPRWSFIYIRAKKWEQKWGELGGKSNPDVNYSAGGQGLSGSACVT